jgi:hypothetical protein
VRPVMSFLTLKLPANSQEQLAVKGKSTKLEVLQGKVRQIDGLGNASVSQRSEYINLLVLPARRIVAGSAPYC